MEKVTKLKSTVAVAVLLLAACLLTGCLAENPSTPQEETTTQLAPSLKTDLTPDQSVGYTLYYGLIDKTTGTQVRSVDEYRQAIAQHFIDNGVGYTVFEAQGAYPADDGTVVKNTTLVFTGIHGTVARVKALVEETQADLNLESVYCETSLRGYGLYGGQMKGLES